MANSIKTNIIVIDDNLKETDPLLVQLKIDFEDAEIILKRSAKAGLDYVLENLANKMIVLLDYDLGAGEPNGTEIFLKIREKTSLLYIIIITAKLIDDIPNKELVDYINKDALAIADKTISLEEKINLVKEASHKLDVKVDSVLEQWILRHTAEELREPYLVTSSGKEHTLSSILKEIRHGSQLGKNMERNILMLAIDLLTRGKKQIDD